MMNKEVISVLVRKGKTDCVGVDAVDFVIKLGNVNI